MWQPVIAEVFGVRPWEMDLLTLEEFNAMAKVIEKRQG